MPMKKAEAEAYVKQMLKDQATRALTRRQGRLLLTKLTAEIGARGAQAAVRPAPVQKQKAVQKPAKKRSASAVLERTAASFYRSERAERARKGRTAR